LLAVLEDLLDPEVRWAWMELRVSLVKPDQPVFKVQPVFRVQLVSQDRRV
jgi:hypothetical protein